jgi:hypothetical protein
MNYPRITRREDKGVLRWDHAAALWRWMATGPYLRTVTMHNGEWRVVRWRL